MIIETILLILSLYLAMGLFTTIVKRKQITEFAKAVVPYLSKEVSIEEQMQLEAAGITMEKTAVWAGHIYCFLKWPSAIHSNMNDWLKRIEETRNVQR